jgi:hypothetical protein
MDDTKPTSATPQPEPPKKSTMVRLFQIFVENMWHLFLFFLGVGCCVLCGIFLHSCNKSEGYSNIKGCYVLYERSGDLTPDYIVLKGAVAIRPDISISRAACKMRPIEGSVTLGRQAILLDCVEATESLTAVAVKVCPNGKIGKLEGSGGRRQDPWPSVPVPVPLPLNTSRYPRGTCRQTGRKPKVYRLDSRPDPRRNTSSGRRCCG